MSDPRLSLRWGVTGQFGTPLFTACAEEYTAKQQAGALSGTMGCKIVDFGEVPAGHDRDAGGDALAFAAERHAAATTLKLVTADRDRCRLEADGLRIALVGAECRRADAEVAEKRHREKREEMQRIVQELTAERDALRPPHKLSRVCAERDAAQASERKYAKAWSDLRVRVSAEAQKIVDIAAALRIQG